MRSRWFIYFLASPKLKRGKQLPDLSHPQVWTINLAISVPGVIRKKHTLDTRKARTWAVLPPALISAEIESVAEGREGNEADKQLVAHGVQKNDKILERINGNLRRDGVELRSSREVNDNGHEKIHENGERSQ